MIIVVLLFVLFPGLGGILWGLSNSQTSMSSDERRFFRDLRILVAVVGLIVLAGIWGGRI